MGCRANRMPAIPQTTDQGSGLFGMLAGVTVFLLLLIAAVQILFNLYATTVVTSAAVSATRIVAGYDSVSDRCEATKTAEDMFWQLLGDYQHHGSADLTWVCNDNHKVKLKVTAEHPTILPEKLQRLIGLNRLNRVIEMRVEDVR